MKFLDKLKQFDKENIPSPRIKKITDKYMNDPKFQPKVIKKVSAACEGLCRWVRALIEFDAVAKVVAPKKLKLKESEAVLAEQRGKLEIKMANLKEIEDKLQSLQNELDAKTKEKKDLEDQMELDKLKLSNAEKLKQGLNEENDRWTESAKQLEIRYNNNNNSNNIVC